MEHLYLRDGKINPKLTERPTAVWGCGNDGKRLCRNLQAQGISPLCFCDSRESLWGTQLLGVTVLPVKEVLRKRDIHLALAFHQWIHEEIPQMPDILVFADFPYEEPQEDASCILCGARECTGIRAHFAPFLVERMFRGGKSNAVTRLIHCKVCDFRFSQYRPTDEEMARLYAGYRDAVYLSQRQKYEPDYSLEPYTSSKIRERRKAELHHFLNQWIDPNTIRTVLDYGGDEGQYIPRLFAHAEKYVFEISGNSVGEGITLLRAPQELDRLKFDFVMCCQVLEHVAAPLEVIQNMLHLLEDNGMLYIEVPNQDYYEAYSDVEINEHINFFSRESMEHIAAQMELETIRMESGISHKGLFRLKTQNVFQF